MSTTNITEAISAVREALANPSQAIAQLHLMKADTFEKAGYTQPASATVGLQGYDLEAAAKKLYPVNTPLRNRIPRITGGFSTQANWKAVTALNKGKLLPGVSEGNRNAALTPESAEYLAAYRGYGHEHEVTFEAGYAAAGFDDVRARSQREALEALMIGEEWMVIGGNTTSGNALGVPATPSGSVATTGGTIDTAAVYCYVVALTAEGVFGTTSTSIPTLIARTTKNGVSENIKGGSSNKSAEGSVTGMTGSTNKVTWTVAEKVGAVAYAWFVGSSTGAANCKFAGITYQNKWVQTLPVSTYAANQAATAITADNSQNDLAFDGMITQLYKAKAGGGINYVHSLDGAALTSDQAGGIDEFEAALEYMFTNFQLTPEEIWIPATLSKDITASILDAGVAPAVRIDLATGGLTGGVAVASYRNRFGVGDLPIRVHPYLPSGVILGISMGIPYPMNNVPSVWRMKMRQDFYSIDWPLTSRKYEYGVYADGVLQGYVPFANFMITNVGKRA